MPEIRPFKLSQTFVEKFQNKQPNWGPLGYVTYLRTYSRKKVDGQNEEFWETCRRVVEGVYNIQKNHCFGLGLTWDNNKAQRSAQEMFTRMWQFKWLPSGRGLWMMGTDHVVKTGSGSLQSCGFVSTESFAVDFAEPFCWMMDMLMLGVGVGFDTRGAGVVKIQEPKLGQDVFEVDDSREGWVLLLRRVLSAYVGKGSLPKDIDTSKVRPAGEPIRGFGGTASGPGPLIDLIDRIQEVLNNLIGKPITVTAIVDIGNLIGRCVVAGNVRRCLPVGTMVHTAGGLVPIEKVEIGTLVHTTKGMYPVTNRFIQGVQQLWEVVTHEGKFRATANHKVKVMSPFEGCTFKAMSELTTEDRVVFLPKSGVVRSTPVLENSRKTSQSELTYDLEVAEAHEFAIEDGFIVHNSAEITFGDPTSDEFLNLKNPDTAGDALMVSRWASNNSVFATVGMDYSKVAEMTAKNGEPGYQWLENARAYSRMKDPPNHKDRLVMGANPCNEQSLSNFENCNLVETFPSLHESYEDFQVTLKYAYLYAKSATLLPTHSAATNQVMLKNRRIGTSMSGIVQALQKHGKREFFRWCDSGYSYLKDLDKLYSDWLCVRESIKITTVKPSGTVSLLPGVTPGIHFPHSEHYIRRIRFQDGHPLIALLEKAGHKTEKDEYSPNTVVVEFPTQEQWFDRPKDQVTMWEQLELAAQMQYWWADNQVSITVTFNKDEAKDIKNALELYETRLKGVSFLPMSEHGYVQAPYEAISKEDYEAQCAEITHDLAELYQAEKIDGVHDTTERFCDGDTCVI